MAKFTHHGTHHCVIVPVRAVRRASLDLRRIASGLGRQGDPAILLIELLALAGGRPARQGCTSKGGFAHDLLSLRLDASGRIDARPGQRSGLAGESWPLGRTPGQADILPQDGSRQRAHAGRGDRNLAQGPARVFRDGRLPRCRDESADAARRHLLDRLDDQADGVGRHHDTA